MMLFVTASSGFDFHQRHVFVRGRVEDDRRPDPLEELANPPAVADVGDDRLQLERREHATQLRVDVEDAVFAVADEDEAARFGHRHLTAELGADRPACAGDEHHLIDDVVQDRVFVPHRLALEQVRDLDVAQPPDGDPVAEELVDSRQNLRRHVEPPAGFRQHADRAAGRGRHRDHDLLDAVLLHDALERVHRPEHRQARDPLAMLHDGIVEKPDDVQAELRIALRFPGDHGAGAARAHDQHALPRGLAGIAALEEAPLRFAEHADGEPRAAGERHGQQEIDQQNRSRKLGDRPHREADEDEHGQRERRHGVGDDDGDEVVDARVEPVPAVHAKGEKRERLDDDGRRDEKRDLGPVAEKQPVEPKRERDERRAHDQDDVGDEEIAVPQRITCPERPRVCFSFCASRKETRGPCAFLAARGESAYHG